jgi:hypothetical protein
MSPGSPAGTEAKDLLKPPDLGQFTFAGAGEGGWTRSDDCRTVVVCVVVKVAGQLDSDALLCLALRLTGLGSRGNGEVEG